MFFQQWPVAPVRFLAPKNLLSAVQRAPQPLQGHHKIIWVIHKTTYTEAVFLLAPGWDFWLFHSKSKETTHCTHVTTEAKGFLMCCYTQEIHDAPEHLTPPLCFEIGSNSREHHHFIWPLRLTTYLLPGSTSQEVQGSIFKKLLKKYILTHRDLHKGWKWAEGDLSSSTIPKQSEVIWRLMELENTSELQISALRPLQWFKTTKNLYSALPFQAYFAAAAT